MRTLLLASAALAALTTAARAQTVEEVVVTRLPARLEEVTGLRVVDRVELEARQTPFAADVLSTIPGVGTPKPTTSWPAERELLTILIGPGPFQP